MDSCVAAFIIITSVNQIRMYNSYTAQTGKYRVNGVCVCVWGGGGGGGGGG